jgi:hypothetical protein
MYHDTFKEYKIEIINEEDYVVDIDDGINPRAAP